MNAEQLNELKRRAETASSAFGKADYSAKRKTLTDMLSPGVVLELIAIAERAASTPASPALHDQIGAIDDKMNEYPNYTHGEKIAYIQGFRDARNAAAELVAAAGAGAASPAPVAAITDAAAIKEEKLWALIEAYANMRAEYQYSTERHLAKTQRDNVEHAKAELRAALAAVPAAAPIVQPVGGELVYQMRATKGSQAGRQWRPTDADGPTCIARNPHWADLYEFRTLRVVEHFTQAIDAAIASSADEVKGGGNDR